MNNINKQTLSGICCQVHNCVHNNGNCCCTASKITVTNPESVHGQSTICETYCKK